MESGVFHGLRVLELGGGVSGPFCSRLFADYGADIIKVEDPVHGDVARCSGPFVKNQPHLEKSIQFLYLNTNKRGISLDFNNIRGRGILLELVSWADIIIENFQPMVLPKLGLGFDVLSRENPGLILTSITDFGQTGPYRDFEGSDMVTCAMGGLMYLSGDDDREPLINALSQSHYVAGMNGAVGAQVALYQSLYTGEGQHVDVSIIECLASQLVHAIPAYAFKGAILGRQSKYSSGLERPVPCSDGYCVPSAQGSQPWDVVAELIGVNELKDSRYSTHEDRLLSGMDIHELMVKGLHEWNKLDLFHAAGERRLVFGMVQDPEELFECPQLRSRGFFDSTNHPVVGYYEYPGEIARFSEGSFQNRRPAPMLGEHNDQIYCDLLGYSKSDLVRLSQMRII